VPERDATRLIQTTLIGEALDGAPLAIFVADDDRRYIAVNDYACRLLGYTRDELLALGVLDVAVNADAQEDYDEMLASGFRTGTAQLRRKDGAVIEVAYRASETTVGTMRLFVSACWPAEDSSSS
jgi:PAS domain S-box-containing protein